MKAVFIQHGNKDFCATFGFVRLENGRKAFLHKADYSGAWMLLTNGDKLTVEVEETSKGLRCVEGKPR